MNNLRASNIVVGLVGMCLCLACNNKTKNEAARRFEIPPAGYAVTVETSDSEQVDSLVRLLVSQRPAPYPSGYWDSPEAVTLAQRYCTKEVEAAFKHLRELGPSAFPALVKHLGDDRYSYSCVVAAWRNQNVGNAVVEVLDDGHYMHGGYKFRETPSGSSGVYLSFDAYLKDRDPIKWAEWAKSKSRLDIQADFIGWCILKENERGYVDENQKKQVLKNYEEARQRVTKDYAEQDEATRKQAIQKN